MASDEVSMATARTRVEALRAGLEASEGGSVRLIETHISWVLLAADLAYKIKKPVRLPFLDFTTLADRRRFCEEELRLNRRFAPDLYLDVAEIRAGPEGPCFGGAGALLEVAVRMRRFADGALWLERLDAGTLTAAHVDAFARRLADAHAEAAVAPPDSGFATSAIHERVLCRLVAAIDSDQAVLGAAADADWPGLRAWLDDERRRLEAHFPARLRAGAVRECHGDLHLGNVLQLGEQAMAFDGIEFDDGLRWIDRLDDLAFLAMDLLAHGRRDLAFRLIDAYLVAAGDYDGVPALRFFMVSRALVRAQVSAIGEGRDPGSTSRLRADDYLQVAAALARGSDARLAITHGLPGSGKTFVSQQLLEDVGAIRVRSDVERKRLFGLRPLQSSLGLASGGIYGAEPTRRTYSRLLAIARIALAAGWPTLVDAAFLRRFERAQFAALASALGAPFAILDCRAGPAVLRRRVASRQACGSDASEADVAVLERLQGLDEPLEAAECASALVVDADRPDRPAELARRWRAVE